MQQLLSNYDLNSENDVVMAGIPALRTFHCELDPEERDHLPCDRVSLKNTGSHDNSLETTLDNEDDPLELTGEDECEDSGDAGDGGSSDELQQSRSLSLSYSLSISHAQENFSQYSQSTDKGLSKRYDSPCSYEDDQESECTNFDKLDDWNDFITDMQNNNNNGDFKEYYDDYLASKNLGENDDEDEPTEASNTNEEVETIGKMLEEIVKDGSLDSLDESWNYRSDTPAVPRQSSAMDKCRSFLQYRNPSTEIEIDSMDVEGNINPPNAGLIQRVPSCKRKFRYDDSEEIEYEVTKVVTEKFLKTDTVPFHGCHIPISQIDEDLFAQMVRIESLNMASASMNAAEHLHNGPECSETGDDGTDEAQSTTATTPTNARCVEQMFQLFGDNANAESVVEYQRNPSSKSITNKNAIRRSSSSFYNFCRSNVAPVAKSSSD